jgi:hypothetical protein
MNERRENTLFFLKHLTISTIRKVSATIQAYGLPEYASLLCLHWHQCWYTHDLSMSGNQLSVGNYMVVSYNWIPVFKIYQCYVPSINLLALLVHKKKIFKY